MDRDTLTSLMSTVASEQVFSYNGNVLDERMTRLSEDILEALMCIKDQEDARKRNQQFKDDMIEDFGDLDISNTSTQTGSNNL